MAKLKRLDDLGTSTIIDIKGDARLLFEAGKAIVGINTYLNPSPSTQPADIADDARDAIDHAYQPEMIRSCIRTLRKYHFTAESKELTTKYARLRKLARVD